MWLLKLKRGFTYWGHCSVMVLYFALAGIVVRTEQTRETDAEKGAEIDLRSFISDFNVLSAEATDQ
jgi:hypothetical protein